MRSSYLQLEKEFVVKGALLIVGIRGRAVLQCKRAKIQVETLSSLDQHHSKSSQMYIKRSRHLVSLHTLLILLLKFIREVVNIIASMTNSVRRLQNRAARTLLAVPYI